MEKLMPYILAVMLAIILYFIYKIIIRIIKIITRKKILGYYSHNAHTAEALLYTLFPSKYVLENVYLPYFSADKQKILAKADYVIIMPSGIATIIVKEEGGQIQSDNENIWLQYDMGKKTQMRNPIKENQRNIAIIGKILEKNDINGIDFFNMVIFTSNRIVFSQRYSEIFTLAHASDYILRVCGRKKLNLIQRWKIRRILKRFRRK